MPTPLEAWCAQARALLGETRSSARVSGISRKDLRAMRQDFEAIEPLLKVFAAAYPGRSTQVAKLTQAYGALVKRLEAAADADTTRALHTEARDLQDSVKDQLAAARAAMLKAWNQQLDRLKDIEARDALMNLQWIERDIARTEADTDGEWVGRLATMKNLVAKAREAVKSRLGEQLERDLKRWGEEITKAKALKGGALLAEISRLEEETAAAAANFKACGLGAPPMLAQVPIGPLHTLYEAGFPKRTEGADATVVKLAEQAKPVLKEDDNSMLAFYAGDLVKMNWFTLKKNYKAGKVSEEKMQQAWAFRQKVVDDYIARVVEGTHKLVKGKGWNAVGSVTMESDIDVSILDHHWDDKHEKVLSTDADIVKAFNDWFLGKYRAQPGIMFDVNLYASAKPRKELPDVKTASPVQQAMISMANAGQDVGALMKMRRYMSWEEYEAYQNTVVQELRDGGAGKDDLDTTIKQFEEADSLYQISLANSLNKAKTLIEERIKAHKADKENPPPSDEQLKALQMITHELEMAASATGAEAQKILAKAAHHLEHMADVNMWVNNELYTEGVAEVRLLEEKAEQLQIQVNALPAEAQPGSAAAKELAGVMARLKTLATDSVFFANEAYHSEGPFTHIVVATQGVKSDLEREKKEKGEPPPTDDEVATESKRRRDGLSVHLVLQSFNEQLGDLLKDLAHYAGEDNPGIGLYRSSKYLQRLLDALALLNAKIEGGLGLSFDPAAKSKAVADTLLAARKGAVKFTGIEDPAQAETEAQAYSIEQMDRLFSVKTLGALASHFKSLGASVNGKARKALAAEMRAAKDQEKNYFPQ